jgi:hypothetical protein
MERGGGGMYGGGKTLKFWAKGQRPYDVLLLSFIHKRMALLLLCLLLFAAVLLEAP